MPQGGNAQDKSFSLKPMGGKTQGSPSRRMNTQKSIPRRRVQKRKGGEEEKKQD